MKRHNDKGLSLVELLLVTMIMAWLITGAVAFVATVLGIQRNIEDRHALYRKGFMIMERINSRARLSPYLFIPNNYNTDRNLLLISDMKNDDNDFYFGDPLFPRIDEDPDDETLGWGWGIIGLDDNGDGIIDNADSKADDDEDGSTNEDILNGLDDDTDGNIDEDLPTDMNADGFPGIKGMDDDGDGTADETDMGKNNDDEDNLVDEDGISTVLYFFDNTAGTLSEIYPDPFDGVNHPIASVIVSTGVTDFKARYKGANLINISLQLTSQNGWLVSFSEDICIRNVYQRTGKRVK